VNAVTSLIPATLAADPRIPALIERYDGRAPRYTSYPTALQFTPQVEAETYRRWLGELPTDEPVSLYAHVPFCKRLCWYCGCNTRAVSKPRLVSDYVARLKDELALVRAALPGRMTAGAIHLGGGTPNMLGEQDLAELFGALREAFDVVPDAEIAAEIDPAVLTRDWVRAAASHGLNRASIGVQDLSPHVQEAVNRIESFEVVRDAVTWLREAGVGSINLDLMYGLPRQRTQDVLTTLSRILTLKPERLALFGYAHVPWAKAHQKLINGDDLPGAVERLDQSEAAAALLASAGYVRIGLDHYALPDDEIAVALAAGRLRRNFQGYTADPHSTLIGLGVSAISALPQGYVQNDASEVGWTRRVREGRLAAIRGVALTDEDRFRAEIIERLMCDLSVDLAEVCARHGRRPDDLVAERARLAVLEADGLVTLDGDRLGMTALGAPWLRTAAQAFDVQSRDQGGHSKVL